MIKIFKNKFLISLFVLVITIFITSSCYAVGNISDISETCTTPFSLDDVYNEVSSRGFTKANSVVLVTFQQFGDGSNSYHIFVFSTSTGIAYIKEQAANISTGKAFNSSDSAISCNYYKFYYRNGAFSHSSALSGTTGNFLGVSGGSITKVGDISTIPLKAYNGRIIYEPQKFSFDIFGVDYDTVRLEIYNLDSNLKMFGYYNINNSYNVGDILDINSMVSNIRLLSGNNDNTDLWCNINLGEIITYYIVDSDYNILDIGEFNQMAVGDFLYGFNVKNRDAVDFVFVRNGNVYWNNNLNFYYKDSHGTSFINQNSVVSSNEYSLIYNSSYYNSGIYSAKVCDSNDNILASAEVLYQSDWSSELSLNIGSSYYENHVGWYKSCFWITSLSLFGNDITGSSIDFTGYKIRWSIPQNVVVDSLEVGSDSYSKRSGYFTCNNSNGLIAMANVKVYVLIKDYVPFDFTFEVYDSDDNLVLTQKLNSDSIVSTEIVSNENDVEQPNYDIVNNPNYTGSSNSNYSSNSFDYNSISDWTVDDYSKLMSTNNTIWEFFKAILGNLPWWITTPFFILILGVVIISLIRFARGA